MEGSKQSLPTERSRMAAADVGPGQRIEQAMAADEARESAAFAELTGNRLQPELAYGRRFAAHLASGEVAIEPALGPARVTAVDRKGQAILLAWKDDYGPSTAVARYDADQVFYVRVPGPRDRLLVQQQIDRAVWHRSDILGPTARLIASHLHPGPRSLLFRFAINGGILDERLYDELDTIKRNRPAFEPWVQALTRYCLSRLDTEPVPGWTPDPPEPAVGEQSNDPSIVATGQGRRRRELPRYIASATVEQLLDAAFDLGVAAARSGVSRTTLGRLARWRARARSRRRHSGIQG